MQIGLKPPMSLSMRMRSEASVSAVRKDLDLETTLPRLGHSTMMGSTSSLGTNSSPGRPKKDMAAASESRYPFERLSGSLDFVASSGVFADRSVMVNPAAVCVRCAEHASMCMSCTEILCQEALNFYRKTRARGAASLFANAITQTGITKVVKATVFKLWVNGLRYRKRREQKMMFLCEKEFRSKLITGPFRAWRSYTKAEIVEKKNKAVEELEARAAFLEQQVLKASAERSAFEQQAKFVSGMLKDRDKTIADQAVLIEKQAGDIAHGKRRMTGLASLAGPLLALKGMVGSLADEDAREIKGRLLRGAASVGSAHDYSKVYDSDAYRGLSKEKARRRAGKHLTKVDETVEIISMLLNWATCKSRDANGVTDLKGVSLQDYLPKFRVVESIDDLTSSQHILRVVIACIFEQTMEGKTTLRLPSMVDFVKAQNEGSAAAAALGPGALSEELVEDIKSPAEKPGEVAAKALKLASKYLHLPHFNAKDITSGNQEVTVVLLGHLMLASASPAQHSAHIQKVGELIRAHESAAEEVRRCHRALVPPAVEAMHERWEELLGLRERAAVGVESLSIGLQGEGASTLVAAADKSTEADREAGSMDQAAAAAEDGGTATQPVPVPVPVPVPAAVVDTEETKFQRLLDAIDACLEQAVGDPVNPESQGGRLLSQVHILSEALEGAAAVKSIAGALELTRDAGVRLATEVRSAVAAVQYEIMLDGLHWASH